MNISTPLIEIDQLRSLLNDSNLIIIDASNGVDSRNNYLKIIYQEHCLSI
jgi:hypothetical protein